MGVRWTDRRTGPKKFVPLTSSKLLLFYKMQHDISPNYVSSLVPPSVGNTTNYLLRNSTDLITVHTSSQLYYNYFLPSAIRDWNELTEHIRNVPSITTFKNKLNSDIKKIPSFTFLERGLDKFTTHV